MEDLGILMYIFIWIIVIFGFILLMRFIGSWMLRINEIINQQREVINELKKLNKKL